MTARPPWHADGLMRPVAVAAWTTDDDTDRLAVIEDDARQIIRELAASKLALAESESEHRRAMEAHLLALLDVVDGFGRVLDNVRAREGELSAQMKIWLGNFRTVYRLLGRVVQEQGVTPIETPTREFDPRWHTATETVVDASLPPGTIVEEIKRGYVWQRQVLRKTEVLVAREDDGSASRRSLEVSDGDHWEDPHG